MTHAVTQLTPMSIPAPKTGKNPPDSVYEPAPASGPAAPSAVAFSVLDKALAAVGTLLAAGVSTIGLASSYKALQAKAARSVAEGGWGWPEPWMLPIGIDLSILAFSIVNLLLIRADRPLAWVRWVPRVGTLVTIYLNWASAASLPSQLGHAALAALWVVFAEVAAHLYAAHIGAVHGRTRMDGIRASRWLLSPVSTVRIWRQMKLWEITSYGQALTLDKDRKVYRQRLKQRHGRGWRRAAQPDELLPITLASLGVTVAEALALPAAEAEAERLRVQAEELRVQAEQLRVREAEQAERLREAEDRLREVQLQARIEAAEARAEAERAKAAAERDAAKAEAEAAAERIRREAAVALRVREAEADAQVKALEAEALAAAQGAELKAAADAAEARRRAVEAEAAVVEAERREAEVRAAKAEAEQLEAERLAAAAEAERREAEARAEARAVFARAEAEKSKAAADAAEARRREAEAIDAAAEAAARSRMKPTEREAFIVAAMIEAMGEDRVTLDAVMEQLGVSQTTAQDRRERARRLLVERAEMRAGMASYMAAIEEQAA